MTPRERWLAVPDGCTPDRVPCDYRATAEVTRRLLRDRGCADEAALWKRLGIDKCAGVDNQQTLPFGMPADVRREVRENIGAFRGARGYIVAPGHNIQPNTPTDIILALYEAVHG